MTDFPNLGAVITKADVDTKGTGSTPPITSTGAVWLTFFMSTHLAGSST